MRVELAQGGKALGSSGKAGRVYRGAVSEGRLEDLDEALAAQGRELPLTVEEGQAVGQDAELQLLVQHLGGYVLAPPPLSCLILTLVPPASLPFTHLCTSLPDVPRAPPIVAHGMSPYAATHFLLAGTPAKPHLPPACTPADPLAWPAAHPVASHVGRPLAYAAAPGFFAA